MKNITFDKESIFKILIIRLSSLGDIVLTTKLIRDIKQNYPKSELYFVCNSEYEDILKGSIILSIDGKKINDVETLTNYLNQKNNPKAKYQILSRNKHVLQIIM